MHAGYGGGKWITLLVYAERLQGCAYEGQDIHHVFS